MVCDASMTFADHLTNFEFVQAFSCTYFDSAGMLVTGLLVYGAISTAIYIKTGSPIIPFVLFMLIGGAVVSQLAGFAVAAATVLVLMTGAGVLTLAYREYGA